MAKKNPDAIIVEIKKGSLAEELDLMPGDKLLRINDSLARDVLDYYQANAQQKLSIEILKQNGEILIFDIEKDQTESLGIIFASECFDGMRKCKNNCTFCFIKGLPAGLRKTLYIRDDDYRHSFLYGNYITLTNLGWEELRRIAKLKLSPLYVSVHTTNDNLRSKMMGTSAAKNLYQKLAFLINAGITVHTQAVLCPGINDGYELDDAIKTLAGLYPGVASFAVVPVGLTKYNLFKNDGLRLYTAVEAANVINQTEAWQKSLLADIGSRFVFAADEFYLNAKRPLPKDYAYEGYPQFDNGVGLVRSFKEEFAASIKHSKPFRKTGFVVVTGKLAAPFMFKLLKGIKNVKVMPIKNNLFGSTVTVTGLLSGQDIIKGLKGNVLPSETVLISDITLKSDTQVFLDDLSPVNIQQAIGSKVMVVQNRASKLADVLMRGEM